MTPVMLSLFCGDSRARKAGGRVAEEFAGIIAGGFTGKKHL